VGWYDEEDEDLEG